jgi:phage-related protein
MSQWSIQITEAAETKLGMLSKDLQARFLHVADLLQEFGPWKVGLPHVRSLENKLWEMRLKGRDGIARAIYFTASKKRIVVVRIFTTKTQRTPRREIELAINRMKAFSN